MDATTSTALPSSTLPFDIPTIAPNPVPHKYRKYRPEVAAVSCGLMEFYFQKYFEGVLPHACVLIDDLYACCEVLVKQFSDRPRDLPRDVHGIPQQLCRVRCSKYGDDSMLRSNGYTDCFARAVESFIDKRWVNQIAPNKLHLRLRLPSEETTTESFESFQYQVYEKRIVILEPFCLAQCCVLEHQRKFRSEHRMYRTFRLPPLVLTRNRKRKRRVLALDSDAIEIDRFSPKRRKITFSFSSSRQKVHYDRKMAVLQQLRRAEAQVQGETDAELLSKVSIALSVMPNYFGELTRMGQVRAAFQLVERKSEGTFISPVDSELKMNVEKCFGSGEPDEEFQGVDVVGLMLSCCIGDRDPVPSVLSVGALIERVQGIMKRRVDDGILLRTVRMLVKTGLLASPPSSRAIGNATHVCLSPIGRERLQWMLEAEVRPDHALQSYRTNDCSDGVVFWLVDIQEFKIAKFTHGVRDGGAELSCADDLLFLLKDLDVPYQTRSLQMADYFPAVRIRGEEFVVPMFYERKRLDDYADSNLKRGQQLSPLEKQRVLEKHRKLLSRLEKQVKNLIQLRELLGNLPMIGLILEGSKSKYKQAIERAGGSLDQLNSKIEDWKKQHVQVLCVHGPSGLAELLRALRAEAEGTARSCGCLPYQPLRELMKDITGSRPGARKRARGISWNWSLSNDLFLDEETEEPINRLILRRRDLVVRDPVQELRLSKKVLEGGPSKSLDVVTVFDSLEEELLPGSTQEYDPNLDIPDPYPSEATSSLGETSIILTQQDNPSLDPSKVALSTPASTSGETGVEEDATPPPGKIWGRTRLLQLPNRPVLLPQQDTLSDDENDFEATQSDEDDSLSDQATPRELDGLLFGSLDGFARALSPKTKTLPAAVSFSDDSQPEMPSERLGQFLEIIDDSQKEIIVEDGQDQGIQHAVVPSSPEVSDAPQDDMAMILRMLRGDFGGDQDDELESDDLVATAKKNSKKTAWKELVRRQSAAFEKARNSS